MKKVIYKIDEHKYEIVEVNNATEEEYVNNLNRDFERELKKEKRLKAKTISLDLLYERDGYELMDNSNLVNDDVAEKEELYQKLHEAIKHLTLKQQKVIHLYFWNNLTLREIASVLDVSFSTVSEIYYASLKKFLKNTRTKPWFLSYISEGQKKYLPS